MGCSGSREKFRSSEENYSVLQYNDEEILKQLILRTEYENYSFKVREDPEDAFNDILKVWSKLSKEVSDRTFPNLTEEFINSEDEEDSYGSGVMDLSAIENNEDNAKKMVRINTIALKNLEFAKPESESPVPTQSNFNFIKLLGDKIQEVATDDKTDEKVSINKQATFAGLLGIKNRNHRVSSVSFDLLSKKS